MTMASPTSKTEPARWSGRVLRHQDFSAALAERRRAMGEPVMPRNSGDRRTDSKRVLLRALDGLGADW